MSRLRGKFLGVPLANPPQTDQERTWAESWGFRQLPSGQWVYPETSPKALPALAQKYPFGRICKACRSRFRAGEPSKHYCASCQYIITEKQQQLRAIVRSAPPKGEQALRA